MSAISRPQTTEANEREQRKGDLTHRGILIGHRSVRSDRLVLSVDENPETNIFGFVPVLLRNEGAELEERLRFRHSVRRQFSLRHGAIVERGEIEPLMLTKRLLRDDLRDEEWGWRHGLESTTRLLA